MQAGQSLDAIKFVPRLALETLAEEMNGAVCDIEHLADVGPVVEASTVDAHVADGASVFTGETVRDLARVDARSTIRDHELRTDGAGAIGVAQVAVGSGAVIGLALLFTINRQQRVPRHALRARSFLAYFTVLHRTVSRALRKVLRQYIPLMTLPTISINNMIAPVNRRHLTYSRSFINRIAIDTIATVLVVVKALATIGYVTCLAGLHAGEGFVVDVLAGLAFVAGELLDADLAVGDGAVGGLQACCVELLADAAVLDLVAGDVCVAV